MKVVIQRVSESAVVIDGKEKASIGAGLLVLLGITQEDTQEDISWLCNKIVNLRIFNDDNEVMNHSILDIQGEILLISQFTLYASTKKGNRPSYISAAKPEIAIPIYEAFIKELTLRLGQEVKSGIFGADMKVLLKNDGPVTIIIDSKLKV
ncbi:MAG: D-aminoacyl-tRNA deacylase [bacterium]